MIYITGHSPAPLEERAVYVGCGVRVVGTDESNTYRRIQRKNTVFGVAINTHEHRHTSEHNILNHDN